MLTRKLIQPEAPCFAEQYDKGRGLCPHALSSPTGNPAPDRNGFHRTAGSLGKQQNFSVL